MGLTVWRLRKRHSWRVNPTGVSPFMAFKTMEEHAIISGVNAESNRGSPEKKARARLLSWPRGLDSRARDGGDPNRWIVP